jgi:membrane glycosyltransferase
MTLPFRQPLVPIQVAPPLGMPDQDLHAPFCDPMAPGTRSAPVALVLRAPVLLVPLLATCTLGWLSLGWFALDGRLAAAEGALVGVTVLAFFWVALSVATATLGLFWRPGPQAQPLHGLRVAILLPMYGEAAQSTIGNAVALLATLSGKGRHGFSLHVLSDTRDPGKAQTEVTTVATLRQSHPALHIQYRRRAQNLDYKSGNIRDWVQDDGRDHDAMLILDADSVMGAQSVQQLANALALEPGLGLIQTVPRVLPGRTLWQNMQSFASEVYGTNMGRGFALWTGDEGNFLGHNALVRIRAFASSAGLPHLPGPAPRGGVILSHDFVEAALMRRAGWGVRMMPEAEASFEDTPDALPGYLRRDRRWCQGNMQHLRLLAMPGLHPMSRLHLLQGAMSYLASVWWLVLLVLWALPGQGGAMPDVFADSPFLPVWPTLPPVTQGAIAGLVGLMLTGPKLLGVAGHIRDHGMTVAQAPRFAASVLGEMLLSAMLAPMLMVHQVRAVLRTLAGFDGGWTPHQVGRSDLASLARFHATETLIGLGLLVLALAGQLSPWLLPVAICLSLSMPLAAAVQTSLTPFRHLGAEGTAG